jgi:hypothetical protein
MYVGEVYVKNEDEEMYRRKKRKMEDVREEMYQGKDTSDTYRVKMKDVEKEMYQRKKIHPISREDEQ